MSILSQIIAYAPNKIDTEVKARAMVGEPTDEQTQFGKPIYQTPEGEKVSEKSMTLFFNGDWMNVPSIQGGKAFNEDELRLMIKQGKIQPTSVHKSKDEAEAAAKDRSDSMIQEQRYMYAGGQLVQPSGDGLRPGYSGKMKDTKYGSRIKYDTKVNKHVKIKQDSQGNYSKIYQKPNENIKKFLQRTGPKTFIPTSSEKQKIIKAFPNTKFNFKEYPAYGVKKYLIPGNTNKTNPAHSEVTRFVDNDFKIAKGKYKDVILSVADQNIITDNFELPAGQKKWNFRTKSNPNGFKFGFPISADGKNNSLAKRVERKLGVTEKYTIAADMSKPQGWMMNAMERLYKNELKNGVKPKDLTYKPKFNEKGIIIGFTDTTAAGGNKTYYGLKKNKQKDSAEWSTHGDYKRINKFIDIADGVKAEPDKLLQKILDDKGLSELGGSKRIGKNFTLTLNDILSHQRYYDVLSKTSPRALLERQVVLHHKKQVGGKLAQAAATKDLQLLTGAVNANVNKLENTALKRKLNIDELTQLKNYGAKIVDFDGKTVGGGSTDPTKQFASIKKEALEYAKSDKFNVKTVANYLERLGCGGKFGGGGRINFADGVPSLTKCAQKGVTKLENGLKNGFKNADDAVLARGILKSGRVLKDAVSLRGLFGPLALGFTVAAEAGLVGYDMLSSGKSFREAVGDSVFNYALGDKTKIDSEEEIIKRLQNIKTGPQNYQRMGDEEIGKMQYFKENLKDLGTGFDLYNKLGAIQKNRDAISMSPEDAFNKGAFQLDLDKQEDAVRADIRDYNKTGTPNRVTDYLLSDAAKEGADATALANLLVEQDRLQDAGIGNIYQSRKGDEKRIQRGKEIGYEIENLLNPNKLDEFGEYFISRPKSEQSYIMGLGYKEGGIASLNVKK